MLDRIRERKLVQWVVAYTAAAFVVVSGLEVIKEAFPSWTVVLQTAIVLTFAGLPIVLVIGWFHGEKGRQRVSAFEVVLIGVIVTVVAVLAYHFDVYGSADSSGDGEAFPAVALDSSRFAVMPFRRGAQVEEQLDQELRIHEALSRWTGIEVIDPLRSRDAAFGADRSSRRTAATLGAGRYVDGSVTLAGTGSRVSVNLFDTQSGMRIAESTAIVPAGETLSDSAAARMARQLLFPGSWMPRPGDDNPATSSYPARRAFIAAMDAIDRWKLPEADSLLGVAVSHDPRYGRALFWRAQARSWAGRGPAELLGLVESALADARVMDRREELLADGLRHMGREEYLQACAAFDSLRVLDERDFGAWYGLGECRARDNVVIPNPHSPTGWAFRSSYRQAVIAYTRAFELFPTVFHGVSSQTFEDVGSRLRVSGAFLPGHALPPDTSNFLARLALVDDTLAFVPFRARDVMSIRVSSMLPTSREAIERQRRLYNQIAERWVDAFPRDREALIALAHTRELVSDPRALETLDAAINVTTDPHKRGLMLAQRVILLLKFGPPDRFAEIRVLADSVLDSVTPGANSEYLQLSVVATVAGRPHMAARLAARGAEPRDWPLALPLAVTSPAEALTAYAAMGGPVDSIQAYERAVEAALQNRIPISQRDAARELLLVRAASLAFLTHPLECFGQVVDLSGYPALEAEGALADGRRGDVIRILSRPRDLRLGSDIQAAEVSYDALLAESWLLVQIGDTAQAVAKLGATIDTRRWSQPGSLDQPALAAPFVRALALRAELAAATNDWATAHRWAGAVLALWGNADAALEPVTDRMRRILESSNEVPRSEPRPGVH